MNVKITFNDGTYTYSENPSQRKMSALSSRLRDKVGICRVEYTPNFYNEFEFNGGKDFDTKIRPCIEEELLEEFRRDNDKIKK